MKRFFTVTGLVALLMGSAASAETLKLVEVITSPERTEVLQGLVDGYKAANPGVECESSRCPGARPSRPSPPWSRAAMCPT